MRQRPDIIVLAHIIRCLSVRDTSCADVATACGMSHKTTMVNLSMLHEHGLIHIGSWGPDARGYPTVRQYRWGSLPDAAKPGEPKSSTDRVRAYRARRRTE